MPRLTARAMAELLKLSMYEQVRILHEQKYPKQQPQKFRIPFYSPALSGIRAYYHGNNDPNAISHVRQVISNLRLDSRRINNHRVLDSFEGSRQYNRKLLPRNNPSIVASVSQLELRLSLDLRAEENENDRFIYYNCRAAALDENIARSTIEIAHWILEENGLLVPIKAIEFVDLYSNQIHKASRRRPSTIKAVKENARIIRALWPTI